MSFEPSDPDGGCWSTDDWDLDRDFLEPSGTSLEAEMVNLFEH